MFKFCLIGILTCLVASGVIERIEKVSSNVWYLGLNINPSDGHVMGYSKGWSEDVFLGTYADALNKDYQNRVIWNHPVSYVAIVRHNYRQVDAVKVFKFKDPQRSMLSRFRAMDPGREVVTEGGPLQESVSPHSTDLPQDPVFSVGGDLAFNWIYSDNGNRVVLTGGHLEAVNRDTDGTIGLGNDYWCNPRTGETLGEGRYAADVRNIGHKLQGSDFGSGWTAGTHNIAAYGSYAIYVSETATMFPGPGTLLELEMSVENSLQFFDEQYEM